MGSYGTIPHLEELTTDALFVGNIMQPLSELTKLQINQSGLVVGQVQQFIT